MATVGDAGVGEGGNFVKARDLADDHRVFEIVNATRKEANQYVDKPQVDFHIRFLDVEGDDAETVYVMSQSMNEVRQKYIEYFAENDEPIRGVKPEMGERGLVVYKGGNAAKGNPPFLFRDATDEEVATVYDAGEPDNSVPF